MNRLTHHEQINKGFIDWQLPFYFSKPVLRHFTHFIDGMSSVGFTGKLTEIHAFSHHQKHPGQHAHPYDFRLFDKETTDSKIQLSVDMMNQLPKFKQPSYLLCDSWYTSRTIIEAALSKGTHVIGALKTNRILYPQGIRIQAKQFATHVQKEDTDPYLLQPSLVD